MKKFYCRVGLFFMVGFVLWCFSNCNFGLNRSRQYSIVSPEDSISNIPSDDFFYINIKSAYYTGAKGSFDPLDFMLYAMDDGPGTDCKISVNEQSATEDLYCILEVAEGDLWYHEINVEYNVPPGMCDYLGFLPHWHYNQETGYGPTTVFSCDIPVFQDGGRQVAREERFSLAKPLPDGWCDAECIREPDPLKCGYKEDAKNLCRYNRGGEDSDLANCCLGEYTIKGGDGNNNGEWGGNVEECIGGLARMNWNLKDKNGFPATLIEQTGSSGLNQEYTLHPLIDKIDRSDRVSFPTANYFLEMEDKDLTISNVPPFYKQNVGATRYFVDTPFVTWACLDKNKEVKHTIRWIIREWNTQEEFIKFKESDGSSGDPDITGREGSGCDYYENQTLSFSSCDDLHDADVWREEGINGCKTNCETDFRVCDGDCDEIKGTCDEVCSETKVECDGACNDTKGTCDTACESTKTSCTKDCGSEKSDCDDQCDSDHSESAQDLETCKTTCTDEFDQCEDENDECDTAETTCKGKCTSDYNTCDTDCDDNDRECTRACTSEEGNCDIICDNDKTTCQNGCNYPQITYGGGG